MKKILLIFIALILLSSGILYATVLNSSETNNKIPVDYYKGHTHVGDKVIGAPSHSGGTDSNGCHNASVPYHCH